MDLIFIQTLNLGILVEVMQCGLKCAHQLTWFLFCLEVCEPPIIQRIPLIDIILCLCNNSCWTKNGSCHRNSCFEETVPYFHVHSLFDNSSLVGLIDEFRDFEKALQ